MKKGKNVLEIRELKSCWGDYMYFGFVNGRQKTEGYEMLEDLIYQNEEFEGVEVKCYKK